MHEEGLRGSRYTATIVLGHQLAISTVRVRYDELLDEAEEPLVEEVPKANSPSAVAKDHGHLEPSEARRRS